MSLLTLLNHLLDWFNSQFFEDFLKDFLKSFLGGLIGALLTLFIDRIRRNQNHAKLQLKKFDEVLDFSLTIFEAGKLEIRTQLELVLDEALPGNQNSIMINWVKSAAETTTHDNVILFDLGANLAAADQQKASERAHLIYTTLRNRVFGRFVNLFDYAARRIQGETFDLVRYLGVLTCEPRFSADLENGHPHIKVIEKKNHQSTSIQKIRVLLFTEKSLEALWQWCQTKATPNTTSESILQQLCVEKDVVLKGGNSPEAACTLEGKTLLDELIRTMGHPPRPMDRKRYIAMAQALRGIKQRQIKYLSFEVPVPRPLCPVPLTQKEQDLTALGGQFFPVQPEEAERYSLKTLSFTPRASRPEHRLYFQGRNGTATVIATHTDRVLLIQKKWQGQLRWALPGGFLTSLRPREEMIRELCEEAIVADPGDTIYDTLVQLSEKAELVYLGPVLDLRNEADAWIVDHVYHLDLSHFDLTLRDTGVRDDTEQVSHPEWVPFAEAVNRPLFASHGTLLRAWLAAQKRNAEATSAILAKPSHTPP